MSYSKLQFESDVKALKMLNLGMLDFLIKNEHIKSYWRANLEITFANYIYLLENFVEYEEEEIKLTKEEVKHLEESLLFKKCFTCQKPFFYMGKEKGHFVGLKNEEVLYFCCFECLDKHNSKNRTFEKVINRNKDLLKKLADK